jgi:CheY-like chemotaxis protein
MAQPLHPKSGAILLVEDCKDMRVGVTQLLELNGFHVSDTDDGEQAINQLSANPGNFALVLLDLVLPGRISGGDVRARQLADPKLAAVPTVVVSACEPEAEAQAALKPEVWLEKPFRGEQLLSVVRKYVRPDETMEPPEWWGGTRM